VGPVIAERIIAHRDSVGWLAGPADLLAVRGIGPATLSRILENARLVP
jgi:competence protein ComEA